MMSASSPHRSDADLVVKLREARRVVHQLVGEKLERDRLTEFEIIGAVNLAHAAAAERRDVRKRPARRVPGAKRPQPVPLDEVIVDAGALPDGHVAPPAVRVRSSIAPQRLWLWA
jgi:hypothetical protein